MHEPTEKDDQVMPSDAKLAAVLASFVDVLSMTDVMTISRAVHALWDARFVKGALAEMGVRDSLQPRLETIFDAMPRDFKERLIQKLRAEGVL